MVVANAYTLKPLRASCKSVKSSESSPSTLHSPSELPSNDIDPTPSIPSTSAVKVENIPATMGSQQDAPHIARSNQGVPPRTRPYQDIPYTVRPNDDHRIPHTALPIHLNRPNATTYDTGILALSRLLHLRQNLDPQTPRNLNNNLILKQIQILKYLLLMDPRESSLTRYVERLSDCRILLQEQLNTMDGDAQVLGGLFDFDVCAEIDDVMEEILQYLDATQFRVLGILKDMDPLTAVEGLLRIKDKVCDNRCLEARLKSLVDIKFREMAFLQQYQLSAIQIHHRARHDAITHQQPMRYGFTNAAVNQACTRAQEVRTKSRPETFNPMPQISKPSSARTNCYACQGTYPSAPIPQTPLSNPLLGPGSPHAPVGARQSEHANPSFEPQNPAISPYTTHSSHHTSSSNLSQQPPLPPTAPPSPLPEPKMVPSFPSEPWNTPPSTPLSNHMSSREGAYDLLRKARKEARRAGMMKRRHGSMVEG